MRSGGLEGGYVCAPTNINPHFPQNTQIRLSLCPKFSDMKSVINGKYRKATSEQTQENY